MSEIKEGTHEVTIKKIYSNEYINKKGEPYTILSIYCNEFDGTIKGYKNITTEKWQVNDVVNVTITAKPYTKKDGTEAVGYNFVPATNNTKSGSLDYILKNRLSEIKKDIELMKKNISIIQKYLGLLEDENIHIKQEATSNNEVIDEEIPF